MLATHLDELLENIGVEVTRVGDREISGHCPQHEERTGHRDSNPSWSINKITGASICYSCGYVASLSQLVSDITGGTSHNLLRDYRRVVIERIVTAPKEREEVTREKYIGERSLDLFSPVPKRLLAVRGLTTAAATLHGLRWDAVGHCWIIPVRSVVGDLMGWQEKAVGYFNNVPPGMKKSRALFGLDVYRGGPAILVESPLDVVRLESVGIRGGLAAYGAMVSEFQMSVIIAVADRLVLALDNDPPGRKAQSALWEKYKRRIPITFLHYGHVSADVSDIGEMSDEHIRIAVAKASLLGKWTNKL